MENYTLKLADQLVNIREPNMDEYLKISELQALDPTKSAKPIIDLICGMTEGLNGDINVREVLGKSSFSDALSFIKQFTEKLEDIKKELGPTP